MMKIDSNLGGSVDGTAGGQIGPIKEQVRAAEDLGYNGVWTTEVAHDPFLPLALAAEHSEKLELGTAITVAFARNPMTTATVANDLQSMSGGRLMLGLGSQIKAHVERRFSMPWSQPAARMAEYVEALQAIWASWASGDPLKFEGEFYRHTLMPELFRPANQGYPPPRVLISAVGPLMTRTAATVADGILIHGFTTERYLRTTTHPQIQAGLAVAARDRGDFAVVYPGLVVTASEEKDYRAADRAVRRQISFYGSTPAYSQVLELHGLGDLHTELHRLSKDGHWDTMAGLIEDDVLDLFAVCGEPAAVGAEIVKRFSGLVDRFTLYTPYQLDADAHSAVLVALKKEQSQT